VTKGPGSKAAGLAMAFKLLEAAQDRWRAVNGPHLVALVRAGARFERGKLIERPKEAPDEGHQRGRRVIKRDQRSTGFDDSSTAGAAIFPRHGLRRPEWQRDALHFSDLQQWQPGALAVHLARQTEHERLEALAIRLVWASRIVWRKYVWLQWSLLAAGVAAAVLTASYLL